MCVPHAHLPVIVVMGTSGAGVHHWCVPLCECGTGIPALAARSSCDCRPLPLRLGASSGLRPGVSHPPPSLPLALALAATGAPGREGLRAGMSALPH